jgi:hypothetical protein
MKNLSILSDQMRKQQHLFFNHVFRLACITVVLFFLYTPIIRAQDTIVKRSAEKVIAKIIEVNENDIKYKRFDYQEGPTFSIVKWELKYVVYGNGIKESFENYSAPVNKVNASSVDISFQPAGRFYYYKTEKLPEQNMLDIAWKLQDKKINLFIKKTENNKVFKNCFFAGGLILGVVGFLTYTGVITTTSVASVGPTSAKAARRQYRKQLRQTGDNIALAGVGCELISLVFKFKEIHHAHKVVDLYNKAIATHQ